MPESSLTSQPTIQELRTFYDQEFKRAPIKDEDRAYQWMNVFGAIGFNRWLETIVDANYRWAPPVIVAIVSGVVGYAVTLSSRGRRGS